jgi:diketogulonate reductase-like aldo/keto reductase
MTRHQFLRLAAVTAAALAVGRPAAQPRTGSPRMLTRPLPNGRGALPVIGLGTWQGFDVASGTSEYARLAGVLQALFDAGGSVIDSSPMYGRSEAVAGELLAAAGSRGRAFVATKVWTRGRAEGVRQMEASMRLLRADPIDLMQVHNLLDWREHLATLRAWQAAGRVRHIGVTHYTASAYADLEAVMRAERLDFVQVNYSPDEPEAAQRILPLAAERGMAVLVNRPFGGGGLLRRMRDRPLPPWAAEIGATSWAQLILKWVFSHPAVTCAIPGTSRPEHMADNAAAGIAAPPDAAFWRTHPLPV